MKELPLVALRAFAAVHEGGGVRPAARLLGVAHSSVSRHVAELEAWLEAELVEARGPSRSRSSLTPQGKALGAALAAAFGTMAAAVDSVREGRRRNSVTIGTTASVATRWLLPRLARFHEACPWVEVSVSVDQRLRDPGSGGPDLNLRMGRGPWPGLRCEAVMDDALFPVVSRERWERDGRPEGADYLRRLTLLHDRDPAASWASWIRAHGPEGLDPRRGPRFASSDLVLRAAAQGLGAALARARLAGEDLANGLLVRPLGDLSIRVPNAYWIVRAEEQVERSAVAALVEWLQEEGRPSAGGG